MPFFAGFSPIAPERLGRLRFYGCLKMRLVNTRPMVCVTTMSNENWACYRRKTWFLFFASKVVFHWMHKKCLVWRVFLGTFIYNFPQSSGNLFHVILKFLTVPYAMLLKSTNFNIAPSSAEPVHHSSSLCSLLPRLHSESDWSCFQQIAYSQGNQLIPNTAR